jgi:hypothetical protein
MLGIVELADGVVRVTDPQVRAERRGVRVEHSAASFELHRDAPGDTPVYYRVDYGRLEWGDDLTAFAGASETPELDSGALLAMIHGLTPPPDASPLPGVRRLSVGTTVRLDAAGVTVTWQPPVQPTQRPGRQDLVALVGRMLASCGEDYAIAYSGGLSSAFLAVCALRSGRRPTLLHADLGPELARRITVTEIPGLVTRRVPFDLSELLDHHRITGAELSPPMPDVELSRQLMAGLSEAGGTVTASGALMKDLLSARVSDVGAGIKGWRLLGSEPFHITGVIRTLREARELMTAGVVHPSNRHHHGQDGGDGKAEPDVQPLNGPPPYTPPGGSGIPGLTETGRVELQSVRRSYQAVWKQHVADLPRALSWVESGLLEQGLEAGREDSRPAALPAVDPDVLTAAAGLPDRKLCGIRRGAFRNYLPMRQALAAAGIRSFPETSSGFRLRLAAATHLYRERDKVIAELSRECALADLGLVDPATVIDLLRDGPSLAEHALPLLRLVWLDQWLRGR